MALAVEVAAVVADLQQDNEAVVGRWRAGRPQLPWRTLSGPEDFNAQLCAWLELADVRHHRILGRRRVDRAEADRAAMLTLPRQSRT